MIRIIFYVVTLSLLFLKAAFAQDAKLVEHFDEVIISPHIQVNLIEGNEESVKIESNKVSNEKLNIEVKSKTLRIYKY